MGLEGLMSKRLERLPYRIGKRQHWVKVKNRRPPGISQV
jgi:ATP-dependent DNA ligase